MPIGVSITRLLQALILRGAAEMMQYTQAIEQSTAKEPDVVIWATEKHRLKVTKALQGKGLFYRVHNTAIAQKHIQKPFDGGGRVLELMYIPEEKT